MPQLLFFFLLAEGPEAHAAMQHIATGHVR